MGDSGCVIGLGRGQSDPRVTGLAGRRLGCLVTNGRRDRVAHIRWESMLLKKC